MSNVPKLRKRALEYEQKKQLDKALETYVLILEQLDEVVEEADMALYNRVGDLLLRRGDVSEAVDHYEKAVDLYTDGGYFNNAIALCNKILRNAPGRNSVYYKLGKISARKGFTNDAKQNFLEYADRMQKSGQMEEAFRALKEFADLCPDQDDIRLMLADQLVRKERPAEAIEQLQTLYEKYQAEGRTSEARATVDRMKALDPDIQPRETGAAPVPRAGDLVFLDVSYDAPVGAKKASAPPPRAEPVAAPPPAAAKVAAQTPPPPVAVAPPAPAPPAEVVPEPDMVELDAKAPSLPGISHGAALTEDPGTNAELVSHLEPEFITGFEQTAQGGDQLATVELDDIEPMMELEATSLVDPETDPPLAPAPVMEHPAHAALRHEHDLALPGDLPMLDLPMEEMADDETSELTLIYPDGTETLDDAEALDGAVEDDVDEDVDLPMIDLDEAPAIDHHERVVPVEASASDVDDDAMVTLEHDTLQLIYPEGDPLDDETVEPTTEHDDVIGAPSSLGEPLLGLPEEDAETDLEPQLEDDSLLAHAAKHVSAHRPPPFVPPEPDRAQDDLSLEPELEPEPEPALSVAELIRRELAVSPDDWQQHRRLGEALIEEGERKGGMRELESAMNGFERSGHLASAGSIADELVRIEPASVRYHQKRVEYAVRANDKPRLTDAYLQLADCLFRAGQLDKARAVYARVLELTPDDPRALAALASVGSLTGTPVSLPRVSGVRPAVRGATPPASSNGIAAAPAATSPRRTPPAVTPPVVEPEQDASFVNLADWLRDEVPANSTRMVAEVEAPRKGEQVDFEEMLTRFKQGVAASVDETDHESHYDLGVAYKEMGLLDEAIAEFQKALRGSEYRVRTYEALGQCFVEKRQYQVALTVLGRALNEKNSTDDILVGVLYLLGYGSEALQRWPDAIRYYERVFAVDIQFRDVSDRLAALERHNR